jgi:hypothetical protein
MRSRLDEADELAGRPLGEDDADRGQCERDHRADEARDRHTLAVGRAPRNAPECRDRQPDPSLNMNRIQEQGERRRKNDEDHGHEGFEHPRNRRP